MADFLLTDKRYYIEGRKEIEGRMSRSKVSREIKRRSVARRVLRRMQRHDWTACIVIKFTARNLPHSE